MRMGIFPKPLCIQKVCSDEVRGYLSLGVSIIFRNIFSTTPVEPPELLKMKLNFIVGLGDDIFGCEETDNESIGLQTIAGPRKCTQKRDIAAIKAARDTDSICENKVLSQDSDEYIRRTISPPMIAPNISEMKPICTGF
ncbi:MAG TPA: hypothetical protein P5049_04195 [Methanothrix sp.]|nr:hypothetical protein [Methanothrix sp.]